MEWMVKHKAVKTNSSVANCLLTMVRVAMLVYNIHALLGFLAARMKADFLKYHYSLKKF